MNCDNQAMELFDSHCHLDDPRFDPERRAVLRRAREAGVTDLVIPGVSAETWARTRACCAGEAGVHRAYGLHPYFLDRHRSAHVKQLQRWLETERPVAVGECGLDYRNAQPDPADQLVFFRAQLRLARDGRLPVIVHACKAVDAVLAELRRVPGVRGVIHGFAGSEQQARQLIDLGFKLGIGATVQFDRARRLQRVVARMPLEALLIETDAPDQPGPAHRGGRNEPAYVRAVAERIAELREMPVEELARATADNARALFGLREAAHV